jgi:hypothetical protein
MTRWLAFLFAATLTICAQEKPAPASTNLPTARAVIDRYVKVAGGKEAFEKVNSILLKGRTEVGGKELGGEMTLATAKPNKLVLTVSLAGIAIRSGFDGTNGWQINPLTGPSIMQDAELRDMKRQSDFFAILHEDKNYRSMTNLGVAAFEGEDCYKIKLIDTEGTESIEYYSVKTGLQTGFTGSAESSFGKITATSVNNEHKKYGDLLLPSKVTQSMAGAGLSQTMTVESVEFNTVPASTFELPAEIKALLAPEPKKEEKLEEKPKPAKTT